MTTEAQNQLLTQYGILTGNNMPTDKDDKDRDLFVSTQLGQLHGDGVAKVKYIGQTNKKLEALLAAHEELEKQRTPGIDPEIAQQNAREAVQKWGKDHIDDSPASLSSNATNTLNSINGEIKKIKDEAAKQESFAILREKLGEQFDVLHAGQDKADKGYVASRKAFVDAEAEKSSNIVGPADRIAYANGDVANFTESLKALTARFKDLEDAKNPDIAKNPKLGDKELLRLAQEDVRAWYTQDGEKSYGDQDRSMDMKIVVATTRIEGIEQTNIPDAKKEFSKNDSWNVIKDELGKQYDLMHPGGIGATPEAREKFIMAEVDKAPTPLFGDGNQARRDYARDFITPNTQLLQNAQNAYREYYTAEAQFGGVKKAEIDAKVAEAMAPLAESYDGKFTKNRLEFKVDINQIKGFTDQVRGSHYNEIQAQLVQANADKASLTTQKDAATQQAQATLAALEQLKAQNATLTTERDAATQQAQATLAALEPLKVQNATLTAANAALAKEKDGEIAKLREQVKELAAQKTEQPALSLTSAPADNPAVLATSSPTINGIPLAVITVPSAPLPTPAPLEPILQPTSSELSDYQKLTRNAGQKGKNVGIATRGDAGVPIAVLESYFGLKITGKPSKGLEDKVVALQNAHGLEPDGVVGKDTLAAMTKEKKPFNYDTELAAVHKAADKNDLGRHLDSVEQAVALHFGKHNIKVASELSFNSAGGAGPKGKTIQMS